MNNKNQQLFFITGNSHKYNEISKIFKRENINYDLTQLDLNPIEIQANDLKEVALYKLNSIKTKVKGSFFVEDAGLFINYPLNGFPGVYSSYIFKTIGNNGILKLLTNIDNSKAHFKSIIALYFEPLEKNYIFEGKVEGIISKMIRGSQGFGYDPIFIPKNNPQKTFGEMRIEEKNNISHRSKAITKLIQFLKINQD